MYYKAVLWNNSKIEFEVVTVTDEEAYAKTSGTYCVFYSSDNSCYDCAIRKTKKAAINALRKVINRRIKDTEKELNSLKEINKIIDNSL